MDKTDIIKGKRLLEKNYGRYRIFLTGADKPALTLCRIDAEADEEIITAVMEYDMSSIYSQTFKFFEKAVETDDLLNRLIDSAGSLRWFEDRHYKAIELNIDVEQAEKDFNECRDELERMLFTWAEIQAADPEPDAIAHEGRKLAELLSDISDVLKDCAEKWNKANRP